MKGKVLTAVQNSVVIKTDINEAKKAMSGTNSKGHANGSFNPNKLLNYEILYNNKIVGKISNIIGRTSDFFLVGTVNKDIASEMVGKDIEILKQKRKRKKVKSKKYGGRIK